MTPWGTGAVGKHVLKQIWTQGAAGQTPPPCALLQGAAPTPQAVTETMPCLCLHRCLPSCSTKEANFPIVCKTSKSREESWHSWCGSRGWMACSPSHSPHRILLPDTSTGDWWCDCLSHLTQQGEKWWQAFQRDTQDVVCHALPVGNQGHQKPWSHKHLLLLPPVQLHSFSSPLLFTNFCVLNLKEQQADRKLCQNDDTRVK